MRSGILIAGWLLPAVSLMAAPAGVDFEREVKPFLEAKCLSCHNPNNAKDNLSFAEASGVLHSEKQLVTPGDALTSDLYLVTIPEEAGAKPEMPKKGDPLTKEEAELLRRWIDDGATWPDGLVLREASKADKSWWAYQSLHSGEEPAGQSIDEFIGARLRKDGLAMNPPAGRRELIRRATYGLTGLPPTPEEVAAFVADHDPNAYERLIDRLLASPRYGEHWGRHWLDVIRFGESNGYERNFLIDDLWPFRDYVIRSINNDKPFDQLIREHLAGDVFGKGDPEIAIGSAFLVAGPYDDVGNQDAAQAAQIRANTMDEIIRATGEAFLGMTLGCARCHDHKFDPISMRDYYGLYATFSGIRHGTAPLATPEQQEERAATLRPLNQRKSQLEAEQKALTARIIQRGKSKLAGYEKLWRRPPADRAGTEERFPPVTARFVRLVCEAQDANPAAKSGFRIDEFEVWSAESTPRNVALASAGGKATGQARVVEDFPDAYGPQLAIDGKTGARFFAIGQDLTIELSEPTKIDRVVFSSAKGEENPEHPKFVFVADFRIEVSLSGEKWTEVANGANRKPVDPRRAGGRRADGLDHLSHRLLQLETTPEERKEQARTAAELAAVNREIQQIPPLPMAWIGTRVAADAAGPFHTFVGGNPQRKGETVIPASLSTLSDVAPPYRLAPDADESARRQALAGWIAHPDNPLTPRVLANRLWHYHFGTGIVDTPNDFGYMGGRPTHPELLDFLAIKLRENGWKLKAMHRLIMLSDTYRQSSQYRAEAAEKDGASRLLWRFPPRRLSAEEIRDTLLAVSGKLDLKMGGPGFRLYHFMQDNVSTYEPLDKHGPETWRRAVYHQNARASVVDLMTEFDQPDCAFSTPRRSRTTTPLQALTLLNHSFTIDMAEAFAARAGAAMPEEKVRRAVQLAYQRNPSEPESAQLTKAIRDLGLRAVCRALLNSSELIYLD